MRDTALSYVKKLESDEPHVLCAVQRVRLDAQQEASPALRVPVVTADSQPDRQLRHLEREKLFLFEVSGLMVSLVTRRGQKRDQSGVTEMDSACGSPSESSCTTL